MDIQIKERGNKGFAIATENDKRAGLMTYTIPEDDYIVINHTEVEEEFNGRGVGKKLLYKNVEMAREKNIKIKPVCPFANALFQKLDDLKDVLKS